MAPAEFASPSVFNDVHIMDGTIHTLKCGYVYCSLNRGKTDAFEASGTAVQSHFNVHAHDVAVIIAKRVCDI